ncbi:MAG TPA: EAL domain-containing protein, partial [Gammaproteobacteria bacterium]|nr:EAL domain-containing protein [Gammaproteobacteria bacterium]
MAKQEQLLRLVIAEESVNDAEQLISVLRNAGIAVRPTRVEDDEDLEKALSTQGQDLFLCAPGLDGLPLEKGLRVLEQSGKDIPTLALTDAEDATLRGELMELGAVDLVAKSDTHHFLLTVQRELRSLQGRRRARQLEAALRETERRCRTLLDSSRDAIAYVHDGMHVYANKSYLERFGFDEFEDIEGLPVLDLVSPDDQGRFKEFLRRTARNPGEEESIELSIRAEGGLDERAVMNFSEASWDGEPCTQILIREQVAETEFAERLETLSRQDQLTGLYNRQHFMEQLDRVVTAAVKGGDEMQSGVLYIQPDNLDALRQNLGITAVDLVMSDIAGIVERHVDGAACAARFADQVVTVLLPGSGVHETLACAEAIRGEVEQHVSESGNRTITKSCSVGAAVLSDGIGDAHQVVNLAFEACEIARREGGDRVHLHAAAEDSGAGATDDWATRIRDALAGDSFYLVYHPMVALTGDQSERYEIRLRMYEEDLGDVAPAEILAEAERHGLAAEVDRWVLDHTLKALADRDPGAEAATAFLKVTGAALGDPAFIDYLAERLSASGLPGSRLVFELSEPVAVTQLNQAKRFYKGIKEQRCGFAIDQFGSGLNPFQLIKHLPADYL